MQAPQRLPETNSKNSWLNRLLAYTKSLEVRGNNKVRVSRGTIGTEIDVKQPRRMSAGGGGTGGKAVWL
jgi:hypothetical protein